MQNQHVKNDVLVLMHNKLLPQKIKSEVVDSFRDFYQENICQINQEDVLSIFIMFIIIFKCVFCIFNIFKEPMIVIK